MSNLTLVAASLEPPDGLADFLRELGDGESGFGGTKFPNAAERLDDYLRELTDMAAGKLPRSDMVPMTTFWLLDEAGRVIGMSRLRHELNDELMYHGGHIGYYVAPAERRKGYGTALLAMTLGEARGLSIARVLVCCNSDNAASICVIEANGGVMEDERIGKETGIPFRRYWIDLT